MAFSPLAACLPGRIRVRRVLPARGTSFAGSAGVEQPGGGSGLGFTRGGSAADQPTGGFYQGEE